MTPARASVTRSFENGSRSTVSPSDCRLAREDIERGLFRTDDARSADQRLEEGKRLFGVSIDRTVQLVLHALAFLVYSPDHIPISARRKRPLSDSCFLVTTLCSVTSTKCEYARVPAPIRMIAYWSSSCGMTDAPHPLRELDRLIGLYRLYFSLRQLRWSVRDVAKSAANRHMINQHMMVVLKGAES